MMGPFEAVGSVLSRPFQFQGRAPRSEFWWFVFFDVIMRIGLIALDGYLVYLNIQNGMRWQNLDPWSFFTVYYNLAVFVPYLALCSRRLHDGGFSGFWMLLYPLSSVLMILFSIADFAATAFAGLGDTASMFEPIKMWFLSLGMLTGLALFVLLVWPSETDDNIHGAPWRRRTGKPRVMRDGTVKSDPMQAYALLCEMERKKSPEELAAREALRKEEVRSLYQQRVLGQG